MAEPLRKAFLVGASRHGEVVELEDPIKRWISLVPGTKMTYTLDYVDTGRTAKVWTADTGFVLCRVFVFYDEDSKERGE